MESNDPRILPISDNLRAAIWRADDNTNAAIIYVQARERPEAVSFRITTSAPILSSFWEMPSLKGEYWLNLAESRGSQHYAVAVADQHFLDEPFIVGLEFETESDPRDHVMSVELWDKAGAEPQIVFIKTLA
ncbi:MAG: hypothetical protein ACO1QR_04885 [Chthoniobacteraceae bacterium]